jgi:hypothetical protein
MTVAPVHTQEVLDRVLARVDGDPITLSDVRAAIKLGVVEPLQGVDPLLSGLRLLIDRRLVLAEVTRFAPGEPDPLMLNGEMNRLMTHGGGKAGVAELERTTGIGELQVREIARDNLRIQAYLNQRFGSSAQPTDEEVGQYYRNHLDDFRNANGVVVPFVEAEPIARQRAAAERRNAVILQWMRDLRQRGDVVELYPPH